MAGGVRRRDPYGGAAAGRHRHAVAGEVPDHWRLWRRAKEHPEVHGVSHRLIARVVGVQVITTVIGWIEHLRIAGISGGLSEIDDSVESPSRTDPPVHYLPCVLLLRRPVGGALERGQRAAKDLQPRGVGLGDELLVTGDDLAGLGVARANIVDSLQEDHVLCASPLHDVASEPVQSTDASPALVLQDLVAAYPFVRNAHRHPGAGVQPHGQIVRPPLVGVYGRLVAVGDRVAEGDHGALDLRLGRHIDAVHVIPLAQLAIGSRSPVHDVVGALGQVIHLLRVWMPALLTIVMRHINADREIMQRGDRQADRIAGNFGALGNRD